MAIEIRVPRLGWSMEEGTFSQWLFADGDQVAAGDMVYELEGEKATQAIESFDAGILRLGPNAPRPGEKVLVGQLIGFLCSPGEPLPVATEPGTPTTTDSVAVVTPSAGPSARRLARKLNVPLDEIAGSGKKGRVTRQDILAEHKTVVASSPSSAKRSHSPSGGIRVRVSPRAARLAAELGVNLRDVQPTGSTGRIRECDVQTAAEQLTTGSRRPNSRNSVAAPSSIRHTIANRMLSASNETAAVTLTANVDATELRRLRDAFRQNHGDSTGRPTGYTELCIKLTGAALQRHPQLLQQWTDQGLLSIDSIHIAVAVHTPHGLFTPVLHDVPAQSVQQLTSQLSELVARAQARKLTAAEMEGGTFTVTSLGAYRVNTFTPILNLPQSAILGLGRIVDVPVVIQGQVAVRPQLPLSLTFDHRVVDGVPAAELLTTLCEIFENPGDHLG